MHQVIGECPICRDELAVTRLQCNTCGTTLDGRFSLGPWHRLSAEQLAFLHAFLRNQGKITWVAEELGLSYPTVRQRLTDLLLAMGLSPRTDSPDETRQRASGQRQNILDELAAGRISTTEAERLLSALTGA